jgi:predicted enzyme related to lactoylglutathione lyase
MDWKLELVAVPVSDVDPAKAFYAEDLAWGRFVYFSDPDGNKRAVQELPKRG